MNIVNRREFLQRMGVTVAGAATLVSIPGSVYSHDTVCVLDVSGGMPIDEIHKIMLEASKHNGLLITFDMEVLQVMDLADLTPDTKLRTGGGTCIECVDRYFSEHNIHPRNTIVFTDGYLFNSWGNLPANTKFVITGNTEIKAPYGTTVYI